MITLGFLLAASLLGNIGAVVWIARLFPENQNLHRQIAQAVLQLREMTERLARQEKVRQADLASRYEPLLTGTPDPTTIKAALAEPDTWKKP